MGSSVENLRSQYGISGKRYTFHSPKLLHRSVTSLCCLCGIFLLGGFSQRRKQSPTCSSTGLLLPHNLDTHTCHLHLTLLVLDRNSYFKCIWSCLNHICRCFLSSSAPTALRCICIIKQDEVEFCWNPLDSPTVWLKGQHVLAAFPNGQHWRLLCFLSTTKFSSFIPGDFMFSETAGLFCAILHGIYVLQGI